MARIFITCILVLFIVGGCINSLKNEESTSTQQPQTIQSQQERQKRLDKINNLINDAHKGGLIIKIDRFDMEDKKCAYMIVDEYIWNQLPHETKQHMCRMVNEYNDLTGETILAFKGYRTGITIMPFEFSVHNF